MASTTATHRSSERLDRVRGIAVEAKLDSRQVTVPLRMVGDFPLIMENCGSPTSICLSPISTGKVLRPVRSKDSIDERSIDERSVRSLDSRSIRSVSIDGRSIRSIEEEPETPTKGKVRRSLSRKSHHEYIDVGSCIPPKPPPLPPKNKIEDDYDDEYEYFSTVSSTNSESGNQNMLKQIRILQERNSFLEETNKKLRRENLLLNHQLEEVMKSNPRESEMMRRRKSSLDIISKYHCTEIQSLLCKMDLPQYVSTFAKEKIDGALFLELDDIVLEIELGVSSILHRKRIMHVVRGSQHVLDIMQSNEERTLV